MAALALDAVRVYAPMLHRKESRVRPMIFSATGRLQAEMDAATSYEEWKAAAIAHDIESGVVKWKKSDESKHFDHASIRARLRKLRRLTNKGDCAGVLFTLGYRVFEVAGAPPMSANDAVVFMGVGWMAGNLIATWRYR